MGKKRRRGNQGREKPPHGVHHYEHISEVPWDAQNYFYQRYKIFSRYDEGIWLTDGAWCGVTPEPIAMKLADHLALGAPSEKVVLIDAFAGAGGNTIAFARSGRWKRVYGIEKDPQVLECAKHNAKVYGVQHLISWYQGDCFELIKKELVDLGEIAVLFASPPWGGPGYRSQEIYNLEQMEPYSLSKLISPFRALTKDVALYLPRTSNLTQFLQYIEDDQQKMTVMHYCMEGRSKAICAYFGSIQIA